MNTDLSQKFEDAGFVPATVGFYSDSKVYDIVERKNKTMVLRERKAILVKKPVMVPGGFCAVVVEPAEWRTESDPDGVTRKATLRKTGKWVLTGWSGKDGTGVVHTGVDSYHYDYGF